MGSEHQSLTVQSKKPRRDHHHHNSKGKRSSHKKYQLRSYTCVEIGHFARYFPKSKRNLHKKKYNKRRHHAHVAKDDEPSLKRNK